MHIHQLMAWPPIAATGIGKAKEKPPKSKASQEALGLAEGDVYAVGAVVKRPDYETPTKDPSVDIRI